MRWTADLESDGSRLRNLAGRAAHLGDGLSRHDEAHMAVLRKAAHSLRGATVEDFLDDMEDDGPQHWAPGSHALPFPEEERTSAHTREPCRTEVRSVDSSVFADAVSLAAKVSARTFSSSWWSCWLPPVILS